MTAWFRRNSGFVFHLPPQDEIYLKWRGSGSEQMATKDVKIEMADACAVQCWFRMLHVLGNAGHGFLASA